MATIVAVEMNKGGVGKTTTAFNVAKGLVRRGASVLAIDNDPQGNFTTALVGAEADVLREATEGTGATLNLYAEDGEGEVIPVEHGGLSVLGASPRLASVSGRGPETLALFRFALRRCAERGGYDYVVIDCQPGFGVTQAAALHAADGLLLPTELGGDSVAGVALMVAAIERSRKIGANEGLELIGVVRNKVQHPVVSVERYNEEHLTELYGEKLFRTVLPNSVRVRESMQLGLAVAEYATRARDHGVASAFDDLVDEFIERTARQPEASLDATSTA